MSAARALRLVPVDLSLGWHRWRTGTLSTQPANDCWPPRWPTPPEEAIQAALERAYAWVAQRQNIRALRVLYDLIDDALLAGEFARCDATLAALDVDRLNPSCWIGVLGITARAREHLPSREILYQDILERMDTQNVSPQARSAIRGLA